MKKVFLKKTSTQLSNSFFDSLNNKTFTPKNHFHLSLYIMGKYILVAFIFIVIVITNSCRKEEIYSPVTLDLTQVPYARLSDYHFFEGDIKNQTPVAKVIPYKPASSLFSDYAHKKRFVWMPAGSKATYNGDDNIFEFPVGAALIKTFYYDNVQPANITKIIETRLLIRKSDGWKAYTYVWNDEQTDAFLESTNQGLFVPITFLENGNTKSVNFKIPSQTECVTCHKINPTHVTNGEITIPIAPKPQNLNTDYNYNGTVQNQIAKWKSEGYLGNDVPSNIYSTVNWEDESQPLELRVRSYIDMNCAHCHRDGGHCDYVNMRFNFSNTNLNTFGVCMVPLFNVQNAPFVINAGRSNRSELMIRVNSTAASEMMPIIGRTVVHEEAAALIKEWIDSLPDPCL